MSQSFQALGVSAPVVRALAALNIHAALGMAIYTGRLDLAELARLQ